MHRVEGLLQARCSDLARRRSRREELDPSAVAAAPRAWGHAARETVGRPCADCGEAIAPPRLRAMPVTLRCLHCQRAFESAAQPG